MERWEKQLQQQEAHYRNSRRDHQNPSFSSTLLDAIYRSIDEPNGNQKIEGDELIFYKETMRKKLSDREEIASFQRTCMIEKKKVNGSNNEKVVLRRKSMAAANECHDPVLLNSSSSSSESSCGGGFSSSESDSFHGATKSRSLNSYTTQQKPINPIRTSVSSAKERGSSYVPTTQQKQQQQQQKPSSKHSHESSINGFVKTKSKALKIYSDLKKVKQPISPGGRLASFLNSIFMAGNAKKAKISSSSISSSKSEQTSTCSSASSFSRSCLSKTPSSRGKLSNNNNGGGAKRSVRFYPVSVIVDEDSRPCGHKNLCESTNSNVVVGLHHHQELEFRVMEENRRVVEAAKELLKSYHKKKEEFDHMRDVNNNGESDLDEDDDDASCSSSDLFELDNLSAIGIERYREELPVYETTHLDTNRAIANGLIL